MCTNPDPIGDVQKKRIKKKLSYLISKILEATCDSLEKCNTFEILESQAIMIFANTLADYQKQRYFKKHKHRFVSSAQPHAEARDA